MKYRIIEFDKRSAASRVAIVIIVAIVLSSINPITAQYQWVKQGENFVLFFPVIVGILLYGFATGAVFGSGQGAWSRAVVIVREGSADKIEEVLNERPDQFPTFLMFIGWFILALSSLFIQIPKEMLFLLFFLHITLLLPLVLAMDYWGFTDGIKKIERIK